MPRSMCRVVSPAVLCLLAGAIGGLAFRDSLLPAHGESPRAEASIPAPKLNIRINPDAPAAYPHIHNLTAPLRAAAMRVGDASTAHLWAGTGYRNMSPGPAREVVLTIGAAA